MRGRKPKAESAKILTGTFRRTAARFTSLEPLEPLSEVPPHQLTPIQADIWRELVRNAPRGLLCMADREMMVSLALAIDIRERALSELNGAKPVVNNRLGNPVPNPLLVVANQQASLIARLCGELGFTPVSRMRVHSGGTKSQPDPADHYFE